MCSIWVKLEHVVDVITVAKDNPLRNIRKYVICINQVVCRIRNEVLPPVSLWGLGRKKDRIDERALSKEDETKLPRRPRENGADQMNLLLLPPDQ